MFPKKLLIAIFIGVSVFATAAASIEHQTQNPNLDLLTGARLSRVTFLQLPMCGGDSGWGAA